MSDTELAPPPGGLHVSLLPMGDPAIVAAADQAARHWTSDEPGALRPGTAAHRHAVWRMFRETFNPYRPTIIDWPKLDEEAKQRLISLPIWDIAVQTEGRARLRMVTYAETVRDPEWAYLVTGYSECIDSFFAFGLFALARRSGFFPAELVETFEPVMQEECRHILLFANWLAAHRATMPWWRRPWFEARVAAVWVFLAWERIGIARGMDGGKGGKAKPQDNNFTVTGSKAVSDVDVEPRELMELCLTEHDRRFAGSDARLLRPTTTPTLVRLALRFLSRKAKPVTN